MHLSWTKMVLKAQKSLKKTKIHSWRQVRIHGFVAHWNKTSRFFFPLVAGGNLKCCNSEQNWGSCQGISREIPGELSGGSPHFGAGLSWKSLFSRENDLCSSGCLGWRDVCWKEPRWKLRREEIVVVLQRTGGILGLGESSSASSP